MLLQAEHCLFRMERCASQFCILLLTIHRAESCRPKDGTLHKMSGKKCWRNIEQFLKAGKINVLYKALFIVFAGLSCLVLSRCSTNQTLLLLPTSMPPSCIESGKKAKGKRKTTKLLFCETFLLSLLLLNFFVQLRLKCWLRNHYVCYHCVNAGSRCSIRRRRQKRTVSMYQRRWKNTVSRPSPSRGQRRVLTPVTWLTSIRTTIWTTMTAMMHYAMMTRIRVMVTSNLLTLTCYDLWRSVHATFYNPV